MGYSYYATREEVFTKQKVAIRNLSKVIDLREHCRDLFRQLGIKTVLVSKFQPVSYGVRRNSTIWK